MKFEESREVHGCKEKSGGEWINLRERSNQDQTTVVMSTVAWLIAVGGVGRGYLRRWVAGVIGGAMTVG